MNNYYVTVTKREQSAILHRLDENVPGQYPIEAAESADAALDRFHNIVPIKTLDDFDITAEPIWTEEMRCIDAGIEAAQAVVDNWSSGDLASAVNGLEDWATQAADLLPDE